MGIYILLNRYYFQTRKGKAKEFIERKRIIQKLIKSQIFKGFSSLSSCLGCSSTSTTFSGV